MSISDLQSLCMLQMCGAGENHRILWRQGNERPTEAGGAGRAGRFQSGVGRDKKVQIRRDRTSFSRS